MRWIKVRDPDQKSILFPKPALRASAKQRKNPKVALTGRNGNTNQLTPRYDQSSPQEKESKFLHEFSVVWASQCICSCILNFSKFSIKLSKAFFLFWIELERQSLEFVRPLILECSAWILLRERTCISLILIFNFFPAFFTELRKIQNFQESARKNKAIFFFLFKFQIDSSNLNVSMEKLMLSSFIKIIA